MQQIYTCKFDNHDGEAIIGFCLNNQCKLAPQCCLQCVQEKHTNHQVDCKAFQNIKKIIDQQLDEKKMLERNLIQLQENVKNQIDKILKETRKDVSKLQELDQKLKEQQYQEFKENLEYIKQEYRIKKLNIKSQTIRIMDVVNEFKILCDKLKELLIENKQQKADNVLINIDQAEIFYEQGNQLYDEQQYVEAIKCYDQAILLDPMQVTAYQNKGVALDGLQKYDEAIKCYDQAILLDPKQVNAYQNKGIALQNLKQYKQAIECYQIAIKNGGSKEKLLGWIKSIQSK